MWPITVSEVWFILKIVLGWILAKIFHLENRWHVARELATDIDTDAEALQNLKDSKKKKGERPLHKYDVFINHRGPDVKLTFAADLTDALCKAGFHPFLDAKSIGQGRHVFDSIAEALSGACVHVAIFSRRYAESKYCLEELTSMLQSNHTILPVFYNVKPEDLRWIDEGPFAGGFHKHRKRRRQEKIKLWKEALWDISERRGFRIDEFDGWAASSLGPQF